MSVKQLTDFIKKITTETDKSAKDSPVANAFKGLSDLKGEEKLEVIETKLVELAKSQGFDVSIEDVKQYISSMSTQYELNPLVASMLDIYCSSTCHFGTAVGKDS